MIMPEVKREKTEILSISLPKSLRQELVRYAEEQDIPVSQYVKEALRYQLFLSRWSQVQKAFAPAFEKAGIKTDEDVEKYFG